MFLHNYLPALVFKILLLCVVLEHLYSVIMALHLRMLAILYKCVLTLWFASVLYVFMKFSALSYGWIGINGLVTAENIMDLQWKNTWDFILHADSSILQS